MSNLMSINYQGPNNKDSPITLEFQEFRGYLLRTGDKGQSNYLLYNRPTPKHSSEKKIRIPETKSTS